MLHDLALILAGLLVGLFSTMLLGAVTVKGRLDLIVAKLPDLVTAVQLAEALKDERHEMRSEVHKVIGEVENETDSRFTRIEGRLRTMELRVARVIPPTKEETL